MAFSNQIKYCILVFLVLKNLYMYFFNSASINVDDETTYLRIEMNILLGIKFAVLTLKNSN